MGLITITPPQSCYLSSKGEMGREAQLSIVLQWLFLLPFLLSISSSFVSSADVGDRETYIVHVLPKADSRLASARSRTAWHESMLNHKSQLVYSYGKSISGFAARLNSTELAALKLVEGFVQATPDYSLELHTTHSPAFLGLSSSSPGVWINAGYGQGVIVGVLDTGIAAGHPSFRGGEGQLPAPPSKWKGSCVYNASDCNSKLIGAKAFINGRSDVPPYDGTGHGTHVAGTAVGLFVGGANAVGQANGTAAGMAPHAYLAVYKVCSTKGCLLSDILAGIDSAIEDGVDILSTSFGRNPNSRPPPFHSDNKAIATFAAMKYGIFVTVSAGNLGPSRSTLTNEAPWMMTVGASTTDRVIRGTIYLENGPSLTGETIKLLDNYPDTYLPLVYPNSDGAGCSSLTGVDVTGMVVLCDDDGKVSRVKKGINVKKAGGVAMIIANIETQGYTTRVEVQALPTLHVSYAVGVQIKSYIQSEENPRASFSFEGAVLETEPAPAVAFFSSRGPSIQARNILKPDIIAPGVNILAAWPSKSRKRTTKPAFKFQSGTSMAAPHISGIAALLKSLHPDWSPAAIKSAIMTSADTVANDGDLIRDQQYNTASPFSVGAGHVNPSKAANPGLIYDIAPENYIASLCANGYSDWKVSIVAGKPVLCAEYLWLYGKELNYPSFMVTLSWSNGYRVKVLRTVTNVGNPVSTYTLQGTAPAGVNVNVNPTQLQFTEAYQTLEYTVTFTLDDSTDGDTYRDGYLAWVLSDGSITVRSPIMVEVPQSSATPLLSKD